MNSPTPILLWAILAVVLLLIVVWFVIRPTLFAT